MLPFTFWRYWPHCCYLMCSSLSNNYLLKHLLTTRWIGGSRPFQTDWFSTTSSVLREIKPWIRVFFPSAPGSLTVLDSWTAHCGGGRSALLPSNPGDEWRIVAFASVFSGYCIGFPRCVLQHFDNTQTAVLTEWGWGWDWDSAKNNWWQQIKRNQCNVFDFLFILYPMTPAPKQCAIFGYSQLVMRCVNLWAICKLFL